MDQQELNSVLQTLLNSGNPADAELAQRLSNELGVPLPSKNARLMGEADLQDRARSSELVGSTLNDTLYGGDPTLTDEQIQGGSGKDIFGEVTAKTSGNNPGLAPDVAEKMAADKAAKDAARAANPNTFGQDLPAPVGGGLSLSPPSLGPNYGERVSGVPAGGWAATISNTATPGNYYGAPDKPNTKDAPKDTGWAGQITNVAGVPVGPNTTKGAPPSKDKDLITADLPNLYGITPVAETYGVTGLIDPAEVAARGELGPAGTGDQSGLGVGSGAGPSPSDGSFASFGGNEHGYGQSPVDLSSRENMGSWGTSGGHAVFNDRGELVGLMGSDKGNEQGNTASSTGGGGGGTGGSGGGSSGGAGEAGGQGNGPDGGGSAGDRRKGGPITKSGEYNLHAGEHVMNPEAVDIIGQDKLSKLNQFALKAKAGQKANKAGKNGPKHAQDTEIAHVTPHEKEMLANMSGGVKVNPTSGLKAFYDAGDNDNGGMGGQGSGMGSEGTSSSGTGTDAGSNDNGGMGGVGSGMGSEGVGTDAGGNPNGGMGGQGSGNASEGDNGPGGAYGGGGVGSTEAFGGHGDWQEWLNSRPQPQIYYAPQPQQAPTSSDIASDIEKRIKDLETYQPIAYQGNWLTYAMPGGTYGGAQHRFQRRTNDPVESNKNIYAADLTYDTNAWPNVPVAYGMGYPGQGAPGMGAPGIAGLTGYGPGQYTPLGAGSPQGGFTATGPYANLKAKSGYGIMGLV